MTTWQVQIKLSDTIPSALARLNGFSSVEHHIIKHCNSWWEIQAVSDVHWLQLSCLSVHTWPKVQDSDINLKESKVLLEKKDPQAELFCFASPVPTYTDTYTDVWCFHKWYPSTRRKGQASPLDNMTWVELYYFLWQDSLLLPLLSLCIFPALLPWPFYCMVCLSISLSLSEYLREYYSRPEALLTLHLPTDGEAILPCVTSSLAFSPPSLWLLNVFTHFILLFFQKENLIA